MFSDIITPQELADKKWAEWRVGFAERRKKFVANMNKFQKELRKLCPDDTIQAMSFRIADKGYARIDTAGHGYLVVPKGDKHIRLAGKYASYKGREGFYLEEDEMAPGFLEALGDGHAEHRSTAVTEESLARMGLL